MVELINPPDPRTLLPPLLACLPLAFVSPRPPPALLPLLSPILRQRVQIISSVSSSPTDSWLRLLCWDEAKAERIQSLVDGASFEPHPVSGEIELPDEIPVTYKRVDEETLQSKILLSDYSLKTIYLWCPDDQEGGGPGWRVAELQPQEGPDDDAWSISIGEANLQARENLVEDALQAAEKSEKQQAQDAEEEDDDADYWAQYDATPGRTPNVKTPAPNPVSSLQNGGDSEASYFSRYADVQPAMDNHDPSEEQPEFGPSSLNGNMLAGLLQKVNGSGAAEPPRTNGYSAGTAANEQAATALNHPRPSSASSTRSDAVAKLEHEAESQSACEIGVKQHISSNIKSLFRLAKSTGIPRSEFESLVTTELELLKISDGE
ncbi:hypothetical protein ASPWEDRAFT_53660 [Aspergillus wentii DTO 134E9]|uniref:Uncharacterized protein n=1 Tax=Aspergillus wentii DTO 134E9 TaxID=1073089 RepID=A0A1L9RAC7_ASPWE|nr:uncharacterized protein ASPWEDRAFT_53660 [Aspergillus wentii DTO 134E9]KAI9934456.1 hypothetical protein MW887_000070 [Aspergillus wentii]OJJ31871.1 hypothetical protein ASPWEDRAFT_53660 [Aspergillus wentii DTO 134E9]